MMLLSLMPMTGISAVADDDSEVVMGFLMVGSVVNKEQ